MSSGRKSEYTGEDEKLTIGKENKSNRGKGSDKDALTCAQETDGRVPHRRDVASTEVEACWG